MLYIVELYNPHAIPHIDYYSCSMHFLEFPFSKFSVCYFLTNKYISILFPSILPPFLCVLRLFIPTYWPPIHLYIGRNPDNTRQYLKNTTPNLKKYPLTMPLRNGIIALSKDHCTMITEHRKLEQFEQALPRLMWLFLLSVEHSHPSKGDTPKRCDRADKEKRHTQKRRVGARRTMTTK